MKRFLLALLVLLCGSLAHAGTFTAATCNYSDVNTIVNGPTHVAVNGDIINIPAGSCTWGNNIGSTLGNLAVTVCIDIEGAGAGSTVLSDDVKKDGNANSSLITFSVACPSNVAIVGNLQVVGLAADLSINSKGHISFYGSGLGFRVHHVTVNTPQTQSVFADWISPGVLDHITVNNCGGGASSSVENGGLNIKANLWGGGGENYGDGSWFASDASMPASAIYWETSTFNCVNQSTLSEVGDGTSGARMVFRFNTINGANTTSHGADTGGRERGLRWVESYQNTFTMFSSQSPAWLIWYRSGSGVVWGNTVTSTPGFLNNMASVANCRDGTSCAGSYPVWGLCNGSAVYDQNSLGTGYRCIDQPGSGKGVDYGGTTTPPSVWAGNDNLPIYIFLNTGNGSEFDVTSNSTNVAQNRDYYLYTASFTGATGVGSGTLASRPSTCTTGVAYWATDQGSWNQSGGGGQGQLYKCTATNTWSLYYTPYTYPHPLALAVASPPTFSPPAGSYVGTTLVTPSTTSSGAIICWNTTGSPQTNGSTGCTTGTLFTGTPISVSSSETIFAVAGGTSYTDSSVSSAVYVINPTIPSCHMKGGMHLAGMKCS